MGDGEEGVGDVVFGLGGLGRRVGRSGGEDFDAQPQALIGSTQAVIGLVEENVDLVDGAVKRRPKLGESAFKTGVVVITMFDFNFDAHGVAPIPRPPVAPVRGSKGS